MADVTEVECRTFGHAWEQTTPVDAPKIDAPHALTLRCVRCSTLRIDGVGRFGDLEKRRYVYPAGYLLDRGTERPTRAELRLIVIKQNRRKRNGTSNRRSA